MAEAKHSSRPSTSTEGFFQDHPILLNAFEEDEALRRSFKFYLPKPTQQVVQSDLHRFGNLVLSPQVFKWCADAERNTPYLRTWDSWGRRVDELITSEGWRNLQDLGITEGIVAIGHEDQHAHYARLYQFLKYHMWNGSCASVTCPSAMTDGAARLLALQLQKKDLNDEEKAVFESAHQRLISRHVSKAWTSGQWMTERPGGSDVRNTETLATYSPDAASKVSATDVNGHPLGAYSISGFKWFSSATDANTAVLLAKEPSGAISAFFAPTRRLPQESSNSELNGIGIQRLKTKLGTHALPTAELVLSDMRAWRVGKEAQGVKEISTILNITRVHNAVGAVGSWGRGLSISRAFSRVRRARGKLLMDTSAHVHTMAQQHVQYRAMTHLTFYTVALLGLSERPGAITSPSLCESSRLLPKAQIIHLLRILTPLAKALTAKFAIAGLQECMESLGGVGYLENEDVSMNIARIYRDSNVLSIWEGTTNIMVDDLLRILKGPAGPATLDALDHVLIPQKALSHTYGWRDPIVQIWITLREEIREKSREDLALVGRKVAEDLGWVVCAILLVEDALSDEEEVAIEVCDRWIKSRESERADTRLWKEKARLDRLIVFGDDSKSGKGAKL